MSWIRLAFGLIREAVGTEEGREMIRNVRSAVRPEPTSPAASADVHALLDAQREEINRNLDSVVQALNEQNDKLMKTARRIHTWNLILTAALAATFLLALLAYFR